MQSVVNKQWVLLSPGGCLDAVTVTMLVGWLEWKELKFASPAMSDKDHD